MRTWFWWSIALGITIIYFFILPVMAESFPGTISQVCDGKASMDSKYSCQAEGLSVKLQKSYDLSLLPYERDIYDFTISKIQYEPKTGTLLVKFDKAVRNGRSLSIKNPLHIYGASPDVCTSVDAKTGDCLAKTEDPEAAFKDMILSILSTRPEGRIEADDSAVIYPTIDGRCSVTSKDENYAAIHGETTATSCESSLSVQSTGPSLVASTTSNQFASLRRTIYSFNTSVIGSGNTLSSGYFNIYTHSNTLEDLGDPNWTLTDGTLIDNTTLSTGDMDGFGSTELVTQQTYVSLDSSSRKNITLNAAGLSYIDARVGTGQYSIFFGRDGWDIANSFGGVWGSGKGSYLYSYFSPYSGTDHDPFLYVEYSAGACTPCTADFMTGDTHICQTDSVTYTDLSSPTPDNWDWYNETTKFSDNQNPILQYNVAGTWNTSLMVENSSCPGIDWENKTDYITVDAPLTSGWVTNQTSVCTYEPILFSDDSSGTEETYWWLFGDSQDAHTENAVHYYDTAGDFDISHEVTNTGCGSDWSNASAYIHVEEQTVTDFNYSSAAPDINETVMFTDNSTGTEESWQWDFNCDGSVENTTEGAEYSWSTCGLKSVCHSTANSECTLDWENKTDVINVTCAAPTCDRPFVSGGTFLDDFYCNSSTSYNFTNYVWADGILNSTNGTNTRCYENVDLYSYGKYSFQFKFILNTTEDLDRQRQIFVFGSQDDTYHVTGNKYYFEAYKRFSTGYNAANLWLTLNSTPISLFSNTSITWNMNQWYTIDIYWYESGKIDVYVDSVLKGTVTNTSFSIGKTGFSRLFYGGVGGFDNLAINETANASFTCVPTSGDVPLTITCTQYGDNHADPGNTYEWQWNDATANSTTENPTHQYITAGTYDVDLCISGVWGMDCQTMSGYITATAPVPVVYGYSFGTAIYERSTALMWLLWLLAVGLIVAFWRKR